MVEKIAYQKEQIQHVKKILVRNLGTIESLIKMSTSEKPQAPLGLVLETSSAEISTCVRMLELECTYVSGK